MTIGDDQPDWIRELYRETYPTAPIYPVGPRNNPATRVSGRQGGPASRQYTVGKFPFEHGFEGRANPPPNLGATGISGLSPPNVQPSTNITGSISPNWSTTIIPPNTPPPNTPPPNTPPPNTPPNAFGPMSRPPPPENMTRIVPPVNRVDPLSFGLDRLDPDSFLGRIYGIRRRNLERQPTRTPGTFTFGSGYINPDTPVYNPFNLNHILEFLRGGRVDR